jgi:hypothetical protein
MVRILLRAIVSGAFLGNASAAETGVSKIECAAAQGGVTTLLEINFKTRLVRTWTKFDTHTDGPLGPSSAFISPKKEKVTWKIIRTVGSKQSRTTYTLDLKKRTLSVVPGAANIPCIATS